MSNRRTEDKWALINPRCRACLAGDRMRRNNELQDPGVGYDFSRVEGRGIPGEKSSYMGWNAERQIFEDIRDPIWSPEGQILWDTCDVRWSKRRGDWVSTYNKVCESADIKVLCSRGEMIFLNRTPFSYGKLIKWPWVLLGLSYLAALFLVRREGGEWPVYLLAALSIVNLYALVFSKGAAIRHVAVATMLVDGGWAACIAFHGKPSAGNAPGHWGPFVIWAALIAYAALLGESAQPPNRSFSRTFLIAAVVIFGIWGVLAIELQYGLDSRFLANVALPLAALAPLIAVLRDVAHKQRGNGRRDTTAMLFLTVSLYLTVLQLAFDVVEHAEQRVATKILGLPHVQLPGSAWLTLLQWKFPLAGVVFAVTVMIKGISVWEQAKRDLWSPRTVIIDGEIAASDANIDQYAREADQVRLAVEQARKLFLQFILFADLGIVLVWQMLCFVCVAVVQDLERISKSLASVLRWFVLPVVAFSVVALLLIAVVHSTIGYAAGARHVYDGFALWGGLVCGTAIILVLCAGSFRGLSPAAGPRGPQAGSGTQAEAVPSVGADVWAHSGAQARAAPEPLSNLASKIGPAALTALPFWLTMSVLVFALWPLGTALARVGLHGALLGPGPLLWVNLVTITVAGLLVAIGVLQGIDLTGRSSSPRKLNYTVAVLFSLSALVGIGVLAIYLGHGPVLDWFKAFA